MAAMSPPIAPVVAPTQILTYAQCYASEADTLVGKYNSLLELYGPTRGQSHMQLLTWVLATSHLMPKAFLKLFEHSSACHSVLLHHL